MGLHRICLPSGLTTGCSFSPTPIKPIDFSNVRCSAHTPPKPLPTRCYPQSLSQILTQHPLGGVSKSKKPVISAIISRGHPDNSRAVTFIKALLFIVPAFKL